MAQKSITTDTVAVERPEGVKTRSTFTTKPNGDVHDDTGAKVVDGAKAEEITAPDGSTKLDPKAEAVVAAEQRAVGAIEAEEDAVGVKLSGKAPSLAPKADAKPRLPRRCDILDEAEDKIMGDRREEYGDARESFERIAALWTALDLHVGNRVYTAAQVALMLDLLKTARLAVNPAHTDSWVDKAGYSALGAEVSGA